MKPFHLPGTFILQSEFHLEILDVNNIKADIRAQRLRFEMHTEEQLREGFRVCRRVFRCRVKLSEDLSINGPKQQRKNQLWFFSLSILLNYEHQTLDFSVNYSCTSFTSSICMG